MPPYLFALTLTTIGAKTNHLHLHPYRLESSLIKNLAIKIFQRHIAIVIEDSIAAQTDQVNVRFWVDIIVGMVSSHADLHDGAQIASAFNVL